MLKICAQQANKKVTGVNIEKIFEVQQTAFKVLAEDEFMSVQGSPIQEQEVLLYWNMKNDAMLVSFFLFLSSWNQERVLNVQSGIWQLVMIY